MRGYSQTCTRFVLGRGTAREVIGGAVSFCQRDDCGFAKCCEAKDKRDGMVRPVRILIADGHTVQNAPDLFRPPKLSSTGPG